MSEQTVLKHFSQVITVDPKLSTPDNPLGIIENGAIALDETGNIGWVGPTNTLPESWQKVHAVDYYGQIALPGLIDSHTHPVFTGNRADEFEARLQGKTYLEIAQAGGGILKTVRATREASLDELVHLTRQRLYHTMHFGITTVEAKSGYGLTTESELKSLQALKHVQEELPLDVLPTFMGAHDVPPEYKGKTDAYVDLVCQEMIPEVAKQGVAEFCDVFCETGYFSVAQSRKILETAQDHGMKSRIHAEEFTDIGGAVMATEMGALSADHLLCLSDDGIQKLAQSNTVATVLPGTAFYLQIKDYAPARKLIDAGATVALATDANPGSCHSENLHLMMVLGCLQMGMLPHEAIQAATLNAAKALGRSHDRGSLTPGKRADIGIYAIDNIHTLLYHFGINHLTQLWIQGQQVFDEHVKGLKEHIHIV